VTGGRTGPNDAFPAREHAIAAREVSLAGERVRVVEAGDTGAFPVLLLHGWGASAYNFRAVLARLADAGLRAIAPDLRGHGWSETRLPAGAWSRDAVVDWVRALLDTLGIRRCVVVGQSIGGAIALDCAVGMPHRVAAAVLLSPIGFTPVRRVLLARWFRWLHPATTPRWMVEAILRRIYGTRGRWTSDDLEEYWLPLRRSDVVSALLQSAREFDFTLRDPGAFPAALGPVVIRFGELDRLIPSTAAVARARRIPGADVAVIPGVGHVPAEEVPDEIAALIEQLVRKVKLRERSE
jgi:pimeloyl-ACP methyl ester carboxylesterase